MYIIYNVVEIRIIPFGKYTIFFEFAHIFDTLSLLNLSLIISILCISRRVTIWFVGNLQVDWDVGNACIRSLVLGAFAPELEGRRYDFHSYHIVASFSQCCNSHMYTHCPRLLATSSSYLRGLWSTSPKNATLNLPTVSVLTLSILN